MEIIVERLTQNDIRDRGIGSWPIWEKEVSVFDWTYDFSEQALILEGRIVIKTGSQQVEIKAGDFVTFPKGLQCTWEVKEPVRKHYNFI